MSDRDKKLASWSGDRQGFQPGRTRSPRGPEARPGQPTGGHGGAPQSRYAEVQAFNRKRTLASAFFNDKQVTRANNKQFASGLRGPAMGVKKSERSPGPGAQMASPGRSPRAPLPPAALPYGSPIQEDAHGQPLQPLLPSPWAASFEAAQRAQLGLGQAQLDAARFGAQAGTTGKFYTLGPQDRQHPAARPQNFPPFDSEHVQYPGQPATQHPQNGSLSVMSIKGAHGQPGATAHPKHGQVGLEPTQYQSRPSPPRSRSGDRGGGKEPAIQNVTITQRMYGGMAPGKSLGGTQQARPLPGQPNQAGAAGPLVMGGSARPRVSPLATVDQKLEHFARQGAAHDSDPARRFVTLQGEQIGTLQMQLGPEDAGSKNVAFQGGPLSGPQYQHGKGSRNSSNSPQGHHLHLRNPNHAGGTQDGEPGPLTWQSRPQGGSKLPQPLKLEALRAHGHAGASGSDGKAGAPGHAETLRSRDFEELNQLMAGDADHPEMRKGQFARLTEVAGGNASQKHLPNQGVPDYQRASIEGGKSSLKPFGRRGTQRLDDESLIGLRVGSGVLAGEDQADGLGPAAGSATATKQERQFAGADAAKAGYAMPDRKQQGQDSPPVSHAGTLMGKSQKASQDLTVEVRNARANAQAAGRPQEAAMIDLSRSTERTRTADRSYQKGQGYSNLQLSLTQKDEAINASAQLRGEVFRAANSVNSVDSKGKILAVEETPHQPGSHTPIKMGGPRDRAGPGAAGTPGKFPNAAAKKAKRETMHVLVNESGAREQNAVTGAGGPPLFPDLDAAAAQRGEELAFAGRSGEVTEEIAGEGSARVGQKARMLQLSPESNQVANSLALHSENLGQKYAGSPGELMGQQRVAGKMLHGKAGHWQRGSPPGANAPLSPLPGELHMAGSPVGSRLVSDETASGAAGLLGRSGGAGQGNQMAKKAKMDTIFLDSGLDDRRKDDQRKRMAVAIGHREGPRGVAANEGMPPLVTGPEGPTGAEGAPGGEAQAVEQPVHQPSAEELADPEQAVLMRILEKMLLRYRVTTLPQKPEYTKYRPRQWETIEDKLRTLDVRAELTGGGRKAVTKDFVAQIQGQIKEIIQTGKGAKLSTQAAHLEQQQKKQGRRANIGVKLQQLRTTWHSFAAPGTGPLSSSLVGFDSAPGSQRPLYHNFNDLRSQSNLHGETSREHLYMKASPLQPGREQADEFLGQKQPRHSRSVAPHQMLSQSPQGKDVIAALQPVNHSQNLMFQSNQDIGLAPNGLGGDASKKLLGARAQLSSASFALPDSSRPEVGRGSPPMKEVAARYTESNHLEAQKGPGKQLAPLHLRAENIAIRAQSTDLEIQAPQAASNATGLTKEQPFLGDTMQSFISKEELLSSALHRQQEALQSTHEYHSQYNRLEGVIKFRLPVVKKSHLYHPGRGDNERLNEIHAKLRDPVGHLQLMERNAIVQNKHRTSAAGPPGAGSLASISRPGFPTVRDSVQSLEPVRRASLLNDLAQHEQSAYSTQFLSMGAPGALRPNLLATITHQSKSLVPSALQGTGSQWAARHPMETQYAQLQEKQNRDKQQLEPQIVTRVKEIIPARALTKRPKVSEWMGQEVMLPILGKNKTSMLHSKDQLELQSIAQQQSCINKPFEKAHSTRAPAQSQGSSKKRQQFGFLARTGAGKKAGGGGQGGGPKKLSEILKQQEKEQQDHEKAQERHLLRQIEKVAQLMVLSSEPPVAEGSTSQPDVTPPLTAEVTE